MKWEKMDKKEAKEILTKELEHYRNRSYNDLLQLLNRQDTKNIKGFSGATYQLEFQAMWDDKKGGNLRVTGAIDDGSIHAFAPLADDFIVAPDGSFVGE